MIRDFLCGARLNWLIRLERVKFLQLPEQTEKLQQQPFLGKSCQMHAHLYLLLEILGTPYTSKSLEMTDETVTVAEISSFQLETIWKFAPRVSAILNITEDHLNRHHTMEEYIRVKELITGNQTKDQVCVLNYEDEVLRTFGESGQVKAKVVYFSSLRELPQGIFLRGKEIVLRAGEKEFVITSTDRLKILGRHNHENTMAAAAMAYYAGVPVENIKKKCGKLCGSRAPDRICDREKTEWYIITIPKEPTRMRLSKESRPWTVRHC